MFIKFVDIEWLCNSYPSVPFESLSHVINQESLVYSWNLGKIHLVHFLKFWNLQNFKKVNSVKLSQICLLKIWLLAQIRFQISILATWIRIYESDEKTKTI